MPEFLEICEATPKKVAGRTKNQWCEKLEWQPIKSAPEEKIVHVCRGKHPATSIAIKLDGIWFSWARDKELAFKPTHWMPLPQPPKE